MPLSKAFVNLAFKTSKLTGGSLSNVFPKASFVSYYNLNQKSSSEALWKSYETVKQSVAGKGLGLGEDIACLQLTTELDNPVSKKINERAVFANNETDLSHVEVYGFDYDYTLAAYTEGVQQLIFDMGKRSLIEHYKYPKSLMDQPYRMDFPVRGLHFDLNSGLFMKLDAFHTIQKGSVHRGFDQLTWNEVLRIYDGCHVPVDRINRFQGTGDHMHHFVDNFSPPEIALLGQVIEHFETTSINYCAHNVFSDVRKAIMRLHETGDLHKEITKGLDEYLVKDPDTLKLLLTLREKGKNIFMVTNSSFAFVNAGMTHMIGPDWRDLFDVVVINARKPGFFTKTRPFRQYDVEKNTLQWQEVDRFVKGRVYHEGNLQAFQNFTNWVGSNVLYLGDHIYTDLADVTLHHGWRTGAIIPEVADEVKVLNFDELQHDISWLVALQNLIVRKQRYSDSEHADIISLWVKERDELREKTRRAVHPIFGSIFRTHHNPTYFSRRLQRFADIYMSSVVNLLQYSAKHTFYPRRGALPHELIYSPPDGTEERNFCS